MRNYLMHIFQVKTSNLVAHTTLRERNTIGILHNSFIIRNVENTNFTEIITVIIYSFLICMRELYYSEDISSSLCGETVVRVCGKSEM